VIKDRSGDLRRLRGGRRLPARVRRVNHEALLDVWCHTDGAVHRPGDRQRAQARASREVAHTNWRVIRYRGSGEVVAIEPNRDYEHIFDGGVDPFWDAVEFAAAELRKGVGNDADRPRA
jgi:hypothetical protein